VIKTISGNYLQTKAFPDREGFFTELCYFSKNRNILFDILIDTDYVFWGQRIVS